MVNLLATEIKTLNNINQHFLISNYKKGGHNVKTGAATSSTLAAYMLMAGYGRHEVQMD